MTNQSAIRASKILVVDDQQANVQLLTTMLQRAGYLNVTSTTDSSIVCDMHLDNHYDLILLDLLMPHMDGFEVMAALRKLEVSAQPSILVVTAQPNHKLRAMQSGANDFISKPFEHSEVMTRIHYVLQVRLLQQEALHHNKFLERTVRERTVELRRSEEMFRELAANIPEALWIRDVDQQTIQYANPAWQKLSGIDAVAGDPLEKIFKTIHHDDLLWLTNDRRKARAGQADNEYRLVHADESERWVHARSFPITNPTGNSPWIVEIIEDITQKREAQQQLVHLARHDALTSLANRTLLYDSLREALVRADEENLVVSVLLIDIDYFKIVNDTLGHAMGDALLCEFAARLADCVRPGDTVGRLGGDEFAVVVLTPADNFNASKVASRITKALQRPFVLAGQDVLVTTSIGIASYPIDTRDFETLLHYADTAMYEAKAAGRKTFRCYNPEMKERAIRKLDIQSALRLALDRGEFVLHYQPKMRVDGGQLASVEALIRWNRPGYGLVAPGDFVPALEEMGLIVPVGTWVVESACRQIRKWQKAGLGDVRIAVNVSPKQVREELFIAHVSAAVRDNRIDPALLEFEITETTLMAHGESTDIALRSLKALGISISIDDFGTGYSNLAYLKRFQVDALKIDTGFIHDITTNADSATIAVAIINMAHNLRLKVIAEGVETQEQLDFLRDHGCDEAQGFFFSKALPEAELSQHYRQANGLKAEPDATLFAFAEAGRA